MGRGSDMVLTASTIAALSTFLVLFLPRFLRTPSLPLPTPSRDLLHRAHTIQIPSAFGPESLAFDPSGRGPYTGVADGRILKWDPVSSSWLQFAFTSSFRHFMPSVLSGDKTGRFIRYKITTKEVTVLLRDLAFANGVALSKDRSFVLVAESSTCRILRYWLRGPNTGQVETFVDLPGYPDNIRRNSEGEFWVALHAKKTLLADWLLRNTWIGTTLLKLPLSYVQRLHALFVGGHHAIVVKLSEGGQVVEVLEDAQGKQVRYASEIEERDGNLWIGSVMMPSVWVYKLHQS